MAAVGRGAIRARTNTAALLLLPLLLCAQPGEKPEYEVKAAFLMNFTKFVEWPRSVFRDAASPLTICILGDDPFGPALDEAVAGETAAGHKLAVARIRRAPAPQSCQVLFVARSEHNEAEIVRAAGPGVLTVGDHEGFLKEGGIIAFVLQLRHVRFDVNLQAAARAELSLSSRLLSVARKVQR